MRYRPTSPADAKAKARMLATRSPFIELKDRWHSTAQLLDWILRVAPSRTLDLYGHEPIAYDLRSLPRVCVFDDRSSSPSLLRKYNAVLGKSETNPRRRRRRRRRRAAKRTRRGASDLLPPVQLPPLMDEICRDASLLLGRPGSRTVAMARNVAWFGLWQADTTPDLSAAAYLSTVETELQNEIYEWVNVASWVPRGTPAPHESEST